MSEEKQLQGGSYTVNEKTHERVLVEQTKPVGDIAPEANAEVVKLAVVKNKPVLTTGISGTSSATKDKAATTATQKEDQ